MSESFADLFNESLARTDMRPGAIVMGYVVAIQSEHVVINAGLKSEAVIPLSEFLSESGELEVQVGDEVEVALDAVEDGYGETRLSREKAKRAHAWRHLEKAFESGSTVNGVISGKVKGGFTVDLKHIRAFLPGSLVDIRPVRDTSYLEGRDLEFKVIKLDERRNNVVVSRRAVVEEEYSAEREALLERLQEGQVLKGIVKNLTDYGAFVDLGGIDGLLHITDMAWRRVKHPSEVVEVGQELDVKVLKFDRDRNRVSLGLKQLGEDPWENIARRYPNNTRVFGKVTNITDYGCFVEIEDGVEGLVHVSEMDWTNKNINPAKLVSVSQEVEVMVLDIDQDRRRISLGMKQCQNNPWETFAVTYQKGDRVSGAIKSITDFGIFIGLNGGIDGLVHLSDLSWDEQGEDAVRRFKKGDEVDAVVLAVDADRERISLGVKQLAQDPFASWMADHPKGSQVKGVVIEVDARQARLDLGDGIEGYLRAADLTRERIDDLRQHLRVGEELEAKFVAVDRRNRSISLSVKARDAEDEARAVEEYARPANAGTTALGDLLKEQMGRRDD
jgi:small subunit ribosomal protein S1